MSKQVSSSKPDALEQENALPLALVALSLALEPTVQRALGGSRWSLGGSKWLQVSSGGSSWSLGGTKRFQLGFRLL